MKFEFRSYTHKELALIYSEKTDVQAASRQFSTWITRDEELLDELKKAGYVKRQKLFTPKQVTLIFDHLGDPDNWNLK